jgi:hypothetical protein
MSEINIGIPVDTVLEAVRGSGGIVSVVAKKLDVHWGVAKKVIEEHPETVQAFQEERERVLDMGEQHLLRKISEGDLPTIKWYMGRIGKDRGYSTRNEVISTNLNFNEPLPEDVDRVKEEFKGLFTSVEELIGKEKKKPTKKKTPAKKKTGDKSANNTRKTDK